MIIIAAQKQEKAATASKVFVLVSTLPDKYRGPDIICPPQIPSTETESAYTGLVSFIVVNIYLAGGALPEAKLDRYLQRANAEHSTPVDKTDKLLNRLISEGYINRIKDNSSGEEVVEYMVGPRGRVEIGEEGVMRLVQTVYGEDAPDDLEQRLSRSLGLGEKHGTQAASNGNAANGANGVSKKGKRRSTKNQEEEADEEEEDEQSDEEDEEQ